MKKLISLFLSLALFAGAFTQTAIAQINVVGSAGSADGTYTTLKLAFEALNLVSASQEGKNIVVTITASTNETAAAVLNPPQIGSWTSLKIYPTLTGLSISGSFATPLIDLNGADNVTIDGRVNQAGTKDLIISNASILSAAGTSTIRFINDATNNTVKYCKVKGSTTSSSGGIFFFSDTSGTTGNDGNMIDNNDITSCTDTNRPVNAIYSLGTSAKENSGNIISNNNIFDFLKHGTSSYGINLGIYNTDFTITGNSFYETTDFKPLANVAYQVIAIKAGINYTVSNNYIGGSAASCGGTNAWRKSKNFLNHFYGIYISVGTATSSNVQGNTIANFDYSNSAIAYWYGIYAKGYVNIGSTAGNIIGNVDGTGSIKFTNGMSGGIFFGLYLSPCSGNVQNNTVASITVGNSTSTFATNFYGIYVDMDSHSTIANNTIGSTTVLNSINANSPSTGNAQNVYGIFSSATNTLTITGNTIANLTNGTTNATPATTGLINGINLFKGSNVISNNTIRDLTIANANTSSNYQASVGGIVLMNVTAGNVQSITGNTIYNLSNTWASFAGSVAGLFYGGPVTPSTVSGNFIHSLSVTGASSTEANLYGIRITSGSTTYSNNIINLGGNTKTTIYGIYENGAANNNNNLYFNTVYIGGTLAQGTNKSYALYSTVTTNTRDFRNNVFTNARSGGTGSIHYAAYIDVTGGTLNCNYNNYFVSGTGGVLGYYGGNKTALPIVTGVTGNDANSSATDPLFANAGGTAALNYYPSATLTGIAGTGVLADYSNYTRTTPKMGAMEFASAPVVLENTVDLYNGATLLASYLNIHDAFDKINDGTHTGSIIVKVTGSQVLSSSAVLNASGTGSANYTDVTVYPTSAGLSISGNGNFVEPLIDLNGSDNVVIDGRVGGTGPTKSLTITNLSIVGPTIRFINDAVGNTVKYCTLKGSSTDPNSGIICFGTTNGTTGNDNNLIDNNDITNALDASRPVNAIFSFGTGTGTENSANTISNNNIFDFLNRGIASFGINLSTNTTACTITGNSFYENTSFVPTATVEYRVININNPTNGQNFTISNNFIGGNAPSCGGTAWTKTNAFSNAFYGIWFSAGTTIASNIQGNTIKNISYTNSAATSWNGISVNAGIVNIGTMAGNTIGAANGNGSITFTNGSLGQALYGISTSSQVIIQNNTIGSITIANSNGTNSTNFYGIYCSGSSPINIKNNVIGSTDVGTINSICASSAATSSGQSVYGIFSAAAGSTEINGNTISKMTNGTTNATVGTTGVINGIYVVGGSNIISNNILLNLTISNANDLATHKASVGGIVLYSSSSGHIQNITGNTIYNLSNTCATFTGVVTGIYYDNGPTASTVSGNFIHSLSATAGNLYGIKINTGATTYSNNIVNLGGNTLTTIYGIYETGATGNNNNLYFNTVYIGGTQASGTNQSYALYSAVTTNTRDFRNNVFSNARSTGGASLHYAAWFNYSTSTNLTLSNNDYYAPGTGGILGRYSNLDVTSVPLISGIDANSLAINPSFANSGGTAAENYIPSTAMAGIAGTNIPTTDYAGTTRAATPTMGAYEKGSWNIIWTGNTNSYWNTPSNWNPAHVPTATDNAVIPHGNNDPIVNEDALTPAVSKDLTIQSDAVLTIAAGKALTVNGTLTNNAGITGLVIQSTSDVSNGTGALINATAGVLATVERFVSGDIWHLISPTATARETVTDFVGLTQNDNLVARNSKNYALAPWDEETGKWFYFKVDGSNTSGLFGSPAQGYQILRATDTGTGNGNVSYNGKLTFKGTLAATDQSIAVKKSLYGWNLIGNPYPCALDVSAFIDVNAPLLDQSYQYIYVSDISDIATYGYVPNTEGLKLAPGEGFFVKTITDGGTVKFTTAMKSNVSDAFKAAKVDCPTVKLTVEDGNGKLGTTVQYIGGATKGLDPGKDAGLFNGFATTFSLFTRLIEDNGVDFTVQALPDNNLESMVVPVGLVAEKGATVTFKATATNLPANYKVYLEDKETGTFAPLDEANSSYTVSLNAASNGTGRFYLHTNEIVSAIDNVLLNEFKVVPMPGLNLVRIICNFDLPAKAMVYDMNGRLVASSELTAQIENTIPLNNASSGAYLLKVESGKGTETVKFIWKRN